MKKYILTFISTFVATGLVGSILGVLYYGPEQAKLSKLFPPGIVNEIPDPVFMLISGIALMLLMIISFDKMGVNNLKNGAVTGAWYGALIFTFFGFQFMGLVNIVKVEFVLIDISISTVIGAFQGAVIGWSLRKFG
mgnify:FL=1|tara:strand:- start:73353 stop:73760 length:408 start_codon:yes stop_codon:yes gene_type:complete